MSTQPQSRTNLEPYVLSPDEIACELNSSLRFQQEKKLLRVAGVFRDMKREKTYGGFAYDSLIDPATSHSMTLAVPLNLKEHLLDGRAYTFGGYLQRKVSGGKLSIEVSFRVTRADEIELPSYGELLVRRIDVFHAKCSRGFKRVEAVIMGRLRAGSPVRLTLLHGADAVVGKDVRGRLDGLSEDFKVTWRGVSLRDKPALVAALKELDDRGDDLIGIIRGGGDLEVFNDVEVAHAAAQMETPLVTAIGHAVDLSLCDQVADKDFATPTALGVFLEEMARLAEAEFAAERRLSERGRRLDARDAELSKREADFSGKEGKLLQKILEERQAPAETHLQPAATNRTPKLLYLAAGIAIGVAVGVLIARGLIWPQAAPGAGPETIEQVQPLPPAAPAPAASPAIDNRRRRK